MALKLWLTEANVITPDQDVYNGVIHTLDTVLLPDTYGTVIDLAVKRYNLSTFISLVTDTDLITPLDGEGPFTIFVPTNAAFETATNTINGFTEEQLSEVLQ